MFSAILRQVSGEHSHYTTETLRQAVVDHLRENPYRDAERTCQYRDFLSDVVRTDDAYNVDTEAPDVEDLIINSIADPHEQAERKWQKYLRRLQAGAYGDEIALTGVAELLAVSIRIVKRNTVLAVDPTIASSHIVLALVGQYHYVSLEPHKRTHLAPLTLTYHLLCHHTRRMRVVFSAILMLAALNKSKQRKNVSYNIDKYCTSSGGVWCALNGMCLHMSCCAVH